MFILFAIYTKQDLYQKALAVEKKNLNLIVLNSLNDKGAGFGGSTNKVTFITEEQDIIEHDLKSKEEVAVDLMNQIIKQIHA